MTDTPRRIAGVSPRLTITRSVVGYAYAANGNTHNPTPRYHYTLRVDGRSVDNAASERKLRQAAKENGAAYLAEVDRANAAVANLTMQQDAQKEWDY